MNEGVCREWILSQEYWDFIIPVNRENVGVLPVQEQLCVQEMDFGYRSVYAYGRTLEPLTIDRFWYNSIPNCYALLDMEAMNQAGISAVQNYPSLQLMGSGVMIGFIDTGIDYQNEVFRNIDGSTRIAGIWDQTIQTGAPPEGLLYGSEYTKEMIDEALKSPNPLELVPSVDTNGHGTYLASIAAGGANVENRFLGAAPESTIAVVKLKEAKEYLKKFYSIQDNAVCFQENDIMLGMKYLNRLADERGMPLVICIALGSNFGGHNSSTLLSGLLNMYANTVNRSVIIGGGNEANQRHHYASKLMGQEDNRTVEIRVGQNVNGFAAEIWSLLPNILTLSMVSPSGEEIPVISLRQGSSYTYPFTFEQTVVRIEYRLLLENNDSQLIFIRFDKPAPGIWKLIIRPVRIADGEFHIWLPIQEFIGGEVYFLESDPDTTITEPATTMNAMTTAYYNGVNNSIDINSGRGYTRNGLIKPDFAAPGVQVTGAGLDGRFVQRSGSSVAAGIAAGAIALLIEWAGRQPGFQNINSSQIRNLIILGANQPSFLEYPNKEWGYGTLDVYQVLDILRRI